jgi:hypothetical protein
LRRKKLQGEIGSTEWLQDENASEKTPLRREQFMERPDEETGAPRSCLLGK